MLKQMIVLGAAVYVIGGDILTAIDGKKVSTAAQIAKTLLESHPERKLQLTISRGGSFQNLDLPLVEMHPRWE